MAETDLDGEVVPGARRLPMWMPLLVLILAQIVLGLVVDDLPFIAVAHAAAVLVVGVYACLRKDLALVICVLAYLTGSEVLWRQAGAAIPYMAGPYLMILLAGYAVLFGLGRIGKDARLALLYVALLLPAAINTIRTAGTDAREIAAFALSGPLALAAFVAFTSQVRVQPWLYRRILWTTLISAIAPLTFAMSFTLAELALGTLEFNAESNFATSGGFGPVQVSSMLSLGVLAGIFLVISEPNRVGRWIAGIAAFVLSVQTLLTFSRGGSTSVVIAVVAMGLLQARDRRIRRRILAIGGLTLALAYFVVFPWLDTFTGGAFQTRFNDTTSSRTELAANDTEIFARNPVLGVGPGMTKYQRLTYEVCQLRSDRCEDEASSHTEFTRMLGEHGIPGIAAIIALVVLAINGVRRKGDGRAFAVALIAWAVAQMFYANLRIVAVPFAFGLAFLRLVDERSSDEEGGPAEEGETELEAQDPVPPAPTHGVGAVVGADSPRPIGFGAGYGSRAARGFADPR